MKNEKELLGFYVSGHPLEPYKELVQAYGTPIRKIDEMEDGSPVRLAGMLAGFTKKFSKNSNKQFGIMSLEDFDSSCECMVYERALDAMTRDGIPTDPGTPLILEATVNRRDENERPRISVEKVYTLFEAPAKFTEEVYLHMYAQNVTPEQQDQLAQLVKSSAGNTKLIICLVREDDSVVFIESGTFIEPDYNFLSGVIRILGRNSFKINAKPPRRPAPKRWKKPVDEAEPAQS